MSRHTCVICKTKRYEYSMQRVFGSSWACSSPRSCFKHPDILIILKITKDINKLQILNLSHLSKIVRPELT